jgi:hypothetical protein
METLLKTRKKSIRVFTKDKLANSKNPKLQKVANLMEKDSLSERIKSYTETYWDQAWSQLW